MKINANPRLFQECKAAATYMPTTEIIEAKRKIRG